MNCLRLTILLLFLVAAQNAFGHGFTLSLVGDQVVSNHDQFATGFENLAVAPPPLYSAGHGFFGKDASFDNNKTFRFEIVSPLYYSNGSGAVPSAAALTGYYNEDDPDDDDGYKVEFDGSSVTVFDDTNTPVLGATGFGVGSTPGSHDMQWVLDSGAAEGVYGFAYRITALNGLTAYEPVIVAVAFHTEDFAAILDQEDLNYDEEAATELLTIRQQVISAAMSTSAVPEPSAWALGIISALGLAGLAWRRRRTRA